MKSVALVWLAGLAAAGAVNAASAQPTSGSAPPPPQAAPTPPQPAPPPAPQAAPPPPPQAAPPPPTPPPPPPAPPTAEAASLLSIIEKVCTPLVHGQDAAGVAAANGLKKTREGWLLELPGAHRITVAGPTVANPNLCTLTVAYDIDQSRQFIDALGGWAAAQNPPLPPFQTAFSGGPGATGWSWYVDNGAFHKGVVFTAQKRTDGKPLGKTYDVGTVLFSLSGG